MNKNSQLFPCGRVVNLMSRREWLCRAGGGAGMIGLASLLAEDGLLAAPQTDSASKPVTSLIPRQGHFPAKAKSVIWLFMEGAPSAVDMFDPKPELDKLKKEHGDDKQAFNKAMFALYKRHKVNPLGGCLPMLLQMPIWIALYRTIAGAVELYHTPLGLWIDDLSASDPYFIMPVCMGALMIVQNAISGSTASMDGMQAKLMKWGMPIMFTAFMMFLPSGLVLYILVNTILTIFQNLYIRRRLAT